MHGILFTSAILFHPSAVNTLATHTKRFARYFWPEGWFRLSLTAASIRLHRGMLCAISNIRDSIKARKLPVTIEMTLTTSLNDSDYLVNALAGD
jgi:hypothetical protein